MSGRGGDYDITGHISKLDDKSSVRYHKIGLCAGFNTIWWASFNQWPGLCPLPWGPVPCPPPSGEEPFPNNPLALPWQSCKTFIWVLSLLPESRAQCCLSTACEELWAAMRPPLSSSSLGPTNKGPSGTPHTPCPPDPSPPLQPSFANSSGLMSLWPCSTQCTRQSRVGQPLPSPIHSMAFLCLMKHHHGDQWGCPVLGSRWRSALCCTPCPHTTRDPPPRRKRLAQLTSQVRTKV